MTRTEFLREQTISGANKCRRTPIPDLTTANEPYTLTERKALVLKRICETMPVYIGPKELIVGTRTFYAPNPGNEDGHDILSYGVDTMVPYVNEKDVEKFGFNGSYRNKTHYTPDFNIVLEKGIGGILCEAENRKKDTSLYQENQNFLEGVIISWTGLKDLINRYAEEAAQMAKNAAEAEDKSDLLEIARICNKISTDPPETFHEAVQLLWFAHLGTMIENFQFVNYGRLDVLFIKYLKDTPLDKAQQIIECLLMKMYDQTDLMTTSVGRYAGQLVVTLGGILPDGEDAVNEVTMMFLNAMDKIRLPDPEFNLRINSKNPDEFFDRAAQLSITGCNNVAYYNDDLFIENLHNGGIPLEYARNYSFGLCQDINIPGIADFNTVGGVDIGKVLLALLERKNDFTDFSALIEAFKTDIAEQIKSKVQFYNLTEELFTLFEKGRYEEYFERVHQKGTPEHRCGTTLMAPLPLLSVLYHGSLEKALDLGMQPYPVLVKGMSLHLMVETINSLAAIKKVVYEDKKVSLPEVYTACLEDYQSDKGKYIQSLLWNAPKWGNDDDFVDDIAKDVLEFGLRRIQEYKTYLGAPILSGLHQAGPVGTGLYLMATPEGRNAGKPVAVTMSPENGTMKNGPTAALCSAAKLDSNLIQWNQCFMLNYYASVFHGNNGKETLKTLIREYFKAGGLQHQPNVVDVEALKKAQIEPGKYKDLIVRLWGVSAHFVDLSKELQDEMIARFS